MAITSRVTKKISSPVTKRNPRPRKYASQADRQAAYRARNIMLEFRAEPKTADNITRIADTLGYPRSDVLLSMVKFALTNHDWARFGLTHKTIPTYKENPTMKPASPAQLAARKRFAEMARSGAFKKATKRKANPITETVIWGLAPGENRDYMEEIMYGGGQKLTKEQINMVIAAATKAGYHSFRIGGIDMTKKPNFAGAVKTTKRKANPATIQYIVFSELSPQKYKQMLVTENKQRAISVADVNQMDGYHSVVEDQVGHLIYDAKTRKGYLQSNPSKRKANPAKKTVSQKVSQLVHEGYPQRQAVAVALSEQRAGKVKRNPSGLYAMKTQYLVSCPATKKNMGFFDKQSDAKIYAQELADKHGMQYAISTVKVPKIQAVHFVVGESTKSFKV